MSERLRLMDEISRRLWLYLVRYMWRTGCDTDSLPEWVIQRVMELRLKEMKQ